MPGLPDPKNSAGSVFQLNDLQPSYFHAKTCRFRCGPESCCTLRVEDSPTQTHRLSSSLTGQLWLPSQAEVATRASYGGSRSAGHAVQGAVSFFWRVWPRLLLRQHRLSLGFEISKKRLRLTDRSPTRNLSILLLVSPILSMLICFGLASLSYASQDDAFWKD